MFLLGLMENYVPEFWFLILLMFLLLLWVSGGYLMYKISKKGSKPDITTQKKERCFVWVIAGLFVLVILMLYIGLMPFITLGIMFSNL